MTKLEKMISEYNKAEAIAYGSEVDYTEDEILDACEALDTLSSEIAIEKDRLLRKEIA